MWKKAICIFVSMLMFATVISAVAKQDTMVTTSNSPLIATMGTDNSNVIKTLNIGGKTAYAYDLYQATVGPMKFDLDNPAGATSIKASTTSPFAGAWINNTWYVITYAAMCQLLTVDPTTGTETVIGNTGIAGGSSNVPMGMAYDDKTGITYATWTPYAGGKTMFYTIDLATGATTHIGDIATQVFIDWACDSNGSFYGEDMTTSSLYQIDPTVPSDTLIGSLGITISYAQGAAFDKDTNTLYLAAYTGSGALYTCDTTTGKTTKIGAFPSNAEVDALAIPYITDHPPLTPTAPNGPDSGITNTEYTFTAVTTDPENEQIYYWFEWGDGTNSGWIGPYNSGAAGSAKHIWTTAGNFEIKVKAKDTVGGESDLSPAHTINIVLGPKLEIKTITGGLFYVKASILNTGGTEATNVDWKIELIGGAFIGKTSTGTIPSIPTGSGADIQSKLIIGLGATTVKVTVTTTGSTATNQVGGFIYVIYIKI